MTKKIVIIFSIAILTEVLLTACCQDPANAYRKITGITIYSKNQQVSGQNSTVNWKKFDITIHYDYTYLSGLNLSFFVNSSFASKCKEDGYKGLKKDLLSVEITSDKSFKGIEPGGNLNNLFNAYTQMYAEESMNIPLSMEEFINAVNNSRYIQNSVFKLKEDVYTDEHQHFEITFFFADGTQVSGMTDAVKFI